MISSMTGYGKGIIQKDEIIAEVEIKSLNNRFLDLSVKLPRSLAHKELELRDIIKNKIIRGKVTVNVYLKREGLDNSRNLFIDKNALSETIKLLKEINIESGLATELKFEHVLNFQYLFFSDSTGDEKLEYSLVLSALNNAIENMNSMRKDEGAAMEKDLRFRADNILRTVDEIEKIARNSVVEYHQKLTDRAKQLLNDFGEFDDRLKLELALLVEKYDITEEIVRLKSHINLFNETLDNSVDVGRKLNFLIQEMNRESNTINSKSISSEISYKGLFIKEELEKIREQIQNIE